MTHEKTRHIPVSILYVFLREGNDQQPGKRDWKDKVGVTRHLCGWANSSAIRASGKSFRAILICFGGEKKQMHSATMNGSESSYSHLILFIYFYFNQLHSQKTCTVNLTHPAPLAVPTSPPSTRRYNQSVPTARQCLQAANWTLRQCRKEREKERRGERGADQ